MIVQPDIQGMLTAQKAEILAEVETTKTLVNDKAAETQTTVTSTANATQTLVSNVNDDVKQHVTVEANEIEQEVKDVSRVEGSLDTTATAVNQHTADKAIEVQQTVTDEATAIKAAVSQHVTDELNTQLASLSFSPIKSVQRGELANTGLGDGRTKTITVGSIDRGKSSLNFNVYSSDNSISGLSVNLERYNELTRVRIRNNSSNWVNFSMYWEVIEYV